MSSACPARPDSLASVGPSRGNYRVVALIVACAMLMEQIDATALATALPAIARDFGAPVNTLGILLTSYLLALAIFIPLSGRVADRYGARSVLRAAMLIFMGGSLLCAFSNSVATMTAARIFQGAGGAMMIPVGRLALLRSARPDEMVSATAWLVTPSLIGPMLGPPLGGLVITHVDWRWIFYLNLPFCVAGVVAASLYIEDSKTSIAWRPDVRGFLICAIGLGCLLLGCGSAARPGGLLEASVLLATTIVMGGLYRVHARWREDPLLDLTVLRDRSFRLSLIGGSLTRITQGAQPFLLPLMFQVGFGLSPALSGSIVLATALGSLLAKTIVSPVMRSFGFRTSLIVNGLLSSFFYGAAAAFGPHWPIPAMMAVLMLAGFFMSFQFTVYNTVAYESIAPERISRASSLYFTFQQLLLSLGVGIGAMSIHASMVVRGHGAPFTADFATALVVVACISASALLVHLHFAPDAGVAMSGHRPRRGDAPE
jgi:EmrB/QacA subfamily drug resistance transporter